MDRPRRGRDREQPSKVQERFRLLAANVKYTRKETRELLVAVRDDTIRGMRDRLMDLHATRFALEVS